MIYANAQIQVEYLGYTASDYFQGVSAVHTSYDEVSVGCGSSIQEAYDEAIDNLYEYMETTGNKLQYELPEIPFDLNEVKQADDELDEINEQCDEMECGMLQYVALYVCFKN